MRLRWLAALGAAALVASVAGSGVSAQATSATTGGVSNLQIRASAAVVRAGMEVTISVGASQVGPGTIEVVNTSIPSTAPGYITVLPPGVWDVTVSQPTAQEDYYEAWVNDNGTITQKSSPITVDWTALANNTSASYQNSASHVCNAVSSLSAGANATSITQTDTLGNDGMGDSWFSAEVSGTNLQDPTEKQFTGGWLSLGWQTSDTFSQTFNSVGTGPNFFQMTAYCSPEPWGTSGYDPAKAFSPTYVESGPAPLYGTSSLYQLGNWIQLSGLPDWLTPVNGVDTQGHILWTAFGYNTHATHWIGQMYTGSSFVIPASNLGAIEINVNGTIWYVDVESP